MGRVNSLTEQGWRGGVGGKAHPAPTTFHAPFSTQFAGRWLQFVNQPYYSLPKGVELCGVK